MLLSYKQPVNKALNKINFLITERRVTSRKENRTCPNKSLLVITFVRVIKDLSCLCFVDDIEFASGCGTKITWYIAVPLFHFSFEISLFVIVIPIYFHLSQVHAVLSNFKLGYVKLR